MLKKELEAENKELKEALGRISAEAIVNGEHLKEQPFIPEYVGFEETVSRGEFDTVAARIYTKDGFNVARPLDTNNKNWIILPPNGQPVELLITNMYNAIVILFACGMEITIKDYFEHNNQMAEEEDEEFAKIEKEMEAEMNSLKKNLDPFVYRTLAHLNTFRPPYKKEDVSDFFDIDNDRTDKIIGQLRNLNLIYFTSDSDFSLSNTAMEANRIYLLDFVKGSDMEGKIEWLEKESDE